MTKHFEVINLDIGGKKISTYYDTLKMSSYFQQLIESKKGEQAIVIETAAKPTYFIDRDGHVFQEIMHYLRSYSFRKKGREDMEKLKVEAKFFKFDALVTEVNRALIEIDQSEDEAVYYVEDIIANESKIEALREGIFKIDMKSETVTKIPYRGMNREQHVFIKKSNKAK